MQQKTPNALWLRQGIQEFLTNSRDILFDVKFNKDDFELVEVEIELENLDSIFDGYKIINLSDIH